jgi:hypothetical protein
MEHWTDDDDAWQQMWRYEDGPDYVLERDIYGRPIRARRV